MSAGPRRRGLHSPDEVPRDGLPMVRVGNVLPSRALTPRVMALCH
jgi:hypothetical protein